jgi:NAD(P)-dependent dehydrogenase (short-subunit alcohol dehydrogenase family)
MDLGLRDRRCLVTGSTRGIGLETARLLLAEGASVVTSGRGAAPAIGEAAHVVADLGSPGEPERVVAEAATALGGLDVLVNNAGIAGPTATVESVTPAEWDRTLSVNLSGQFYCARLAVPALKQAGGGSIINISSTSGRTGLPLRVAYAVSKHAVMGLTETLARELGPAGIRVNAILPGWINNDRNRRVVQMKAAELGITPEAYVREGLQFVSMRTMIEMSEVAQMALFLSSAAARHVSGQAIGVCGNVEYER